MKLVITGGHHSSALPVIKKLKEQHEDLEIFWIGHRYSQKGNRADTLEYKEITGLGLPFYELKAGKFYKTYDPIRLVKIPLGFVQAFFLLLKLKPDAILSFGGYLAVPVVIVGKLLGIQSITHEQTVVTGYANKLISRFAKRILVSWEHSLDHFRSPSIQSKTALTGLPLRDAIFTVKSSNFSINTELPTIYITAGKTGSHSINVWIKEILGDLLKLCNVIHQCGEHSQYKDFEDLQRTYAQIDQKTDNVGGEYNLRRYVLENEIGEAYSKADVVVARSGAHTISELLALQKPSILIPISWVSHNEQYENANLLKNYGLAKILDETELTSKILLEEIDDTLQTIDIYKLNNKSATKLIRRDAAQLITNEVIKLLKEKE